MTRRALCWLAGLLPFASHAAKPLPLLPENSCSPLQSTPPSQSQPSYTLVGAAHVTIDGSTVTVTSGGASVSWEVESCRT